MLFLNFSQLNHDGQLRLAQIKVICSESTPQPLLFDVSFAKIGVTELELSFSKKLSKKNVLEHIADKRTQILLVDE